MSMRSNSHKQVDAPRSAEAARARGHKSSFFKLQIDDLLSGQRPNYDKQVLKVQGLLHRIKDGIECIPDRPPMLASEAEKELHSSHGISMPFPFPRPGKDAKYPMAYCKPSSINVVGSFPLKTGVKSTNPPTIDLAVTLPNELFQEKDYTNYRYFHKRAYYISCIAAAIQTEELGVTVNFDLQDGDSLRPVLLLEPNRTSNSELAHSRSRIRIITAIEDALFAPEKTSPMKNNIRPSVDNSFKDATSHCNAFYNSALRSEATVISYHKYLYAAAQRFEFFKDACILGRTWLQQRGFGASLHSGGFGGFEWAILVAFLFDSGGLSGKPVLLPSYSSYQIFKATIQFLSVRDLMEPLVFSASGLSFPPGAPVVYDGKRGINILYKMTPWSYHLLRKEATLTLAMLNDSRFDNFNKVFMAKIDNPMLRFDHVISIPSLGHDDGTLQFLGYQLILHKVLSKAFGNRVKRISLFSHDSQPWPLGSRISGNKIARYVLIGLRLDAANASRLVDHGPPADRKDDAGLFREFWGEKAELRRFKDGSILESLVWSNSGSASSILYQILVYVLERHLNIPEADIKYIGGEYDKLIHPNSSHSAFQACIEAFQSLQQSLSSVQGIPLSVRQLSPTSPFLRYTALEVEAASSEPVDVSLQLESSTRWPDDLIAIQFTKVAFLLKIGDLLESSGVVLSSRVGLENESSKILNSVFLDIVHTSRIIFRLRIHHDREQILLERRLKEKGISSRVREETASALAAYKQLFIQGPRLTQAIQTLCTRFPLLSPTIRLVKYWFNSHFMTLQMKEEALELLTVHTFVQPYPWETPSSVMSGFLRTLYFISRWDWQHEPLIVDFDGLGPQELKAIDTRFLSWRNVDPAMKTVSLVLASDLDEDGVTWTLNGRPPKVVASRMTNLAKAAIKLLKEKGTGLEITDLFRPSLVPFDFLIRLNTKPVEINRPTRIFKNLEQDLQKKCAKSCPVESFLQELQACYGNSALFFSGGRKCDTIGGVWNPQMTQSKSWSLGLTYSTSPQPIRGEEKNLVVINTSSILNEIARLGDGIIKDIKEPHS